MKPKIQKWKALDTKVLAVASANPDVMDFAVYIGSVKGENHEEEWQEVYKHGTKVSFEIAKVIFPDFADKYQWRR